MDSRFRRNDEVKMHSDFRRNGYLGARYPPRTPRGDITSCHN